MATLINSYDHRCVDTLSFLFSFLFFSYWASVFPEMPPTCGGVCVLLQNPLS